MNFKAFLLAGALTGMGSAHAANLLTNGSFETPNIVANNFYTLYGTGSTSITGWTVVGGDIQLTPDTYMGLNASDGRQWIDMTGIYGYDKGVRSDAVATTLGQAYTLTFDLGNYVPFGTSTLSVSINNGPASLFTNIVNGAGPMDWESMSMSWMADSASAQITFLGVANGALSNDAVIGFDNASFSANPVPVPATAWLLGSGLLGLIGVARRKTA